MPRHSLDSCQSICNFLGWIQHMPTSLREAAACGVKGLEAVVVWLLLRHCCSSRENMCPCEIWLENELYENCQPVRSCKDCRDRRAITENLRVELNDV